MSARETGAALLEGHGRPEIALRHLREAIAEDPDDAHAHALIADAHVRLGAFDDALRHARVALGLEPDLAPALLTLAQAHLGREELRPARDSAADAVAADPEHPGAYQILALALQRTGDEAGALVAARRAAALAPRSAAVATTFGAILLEHGERDAARAEVERALALDPEDELAHNLLAILQMGGMGRKEARASLDRAARLDPSSELLRENLEMAARSPLDVMLKLFIAIAGVIGVVCVVNGAWDGVAWCAGVMALLWGLAQLPLLRLSPEARRLVWDHRNARRFKPWRWRWGQIRDWRPWPVLVMEQVPPAYALPVNLVLVVAGVGVPPLLVIGVLALPFSAYRTYRWARRRRPGASSWRPPGDER